MTATHNNRPRATKATRPALSPEILDCLPPQDLEAERAVLGAILLEPKRLAEVTGAIGPEHFHDARNETILRHLCRLANQGTAIDVVTLRASLKLTGELALAGGAAYIAEVVQSVPVVGHAIYHARLVKRAADKRALLRLGMDLIRTAHAGESDGQGDLLAEVQSLLSDLATETASGPILRAVSDIPAETLEWLWPGRIPMGKLTLIAGDPGLGKSLLTLDIATRISRGFCWPDGSKTTKQGSVIILSAEDDVADTIRPRLEAMGADVSRVHVLEAVQVVDEDEKGKYTNRKRTFSLELDMPALREAIARIPDCRLIDIDPISAYLGKTDSHKNADVRGILTPVVELAQQSHTAVVGVTHLNKNISGAAMYRAMGSLAFVAAARAAWAVVRDKTDATRRLFLPIKMNLAKDAGGLCYSITDVGGVPILAWSPDAVTIPVDEAMAADDERQDAKNWLGSLLADGPVESKEVQKQAKDAGHAWRTILRAKADLTVTSDREGFGPAGRWVWTLPTIETPIGCQEPPSQKVASYAAFGPIGGIKSPLEGPEL